MERQGLSPQQLIEAMRAEVEAALRQVADAVSSAPDGQVIRASEHQVKDVMDGLRARVFERALQLKADSVESDFPPSGHGDGSASAEQGPFPAAGADRVRVGGTAAAALAASGQRAGRGSGRRGAGRRDGGQRRGHRTVLPGGTGRGEFCPGGGGSAEGGEPAAER